MPTVHFSFQLYVLGRFVEEHERQSVLTNDLYRYDVTTHTWTVFADVSAHGGPPLTHDQQVCPTVCHSLSNLRPIPACGCCLSSTQMVVDEHTNTLYTFGGKYVCALISVSFTISTHTHTASITCVLSVL
jgi:hypothetical protein